MTISQDLANAAAAVVAADKTAMTAAQTALTTFRDSMDGLLGTIAATNPPSATFSFIQRNRDNASSMLQNEVSGIINMLANQPGQPLAPPA